MKSTLAGNLMRQSLYASSQECAYVCDKETGFDVARGGEWVSRLLHTWWQTIQISGRADGLNYRTLAPLVGQRRQLEALQFPLPNVAVDVKMKGTHRLSTIFFDSHLNLLIFLIFCRIQFKLTYSQLIRKMSHFIVYINKKCQIF